ncbi:MAG: TolC family protein, partial [Eubacteriales bacterium]|nr:TolC family protein [Eubacteriales bacterium]
MIRWKKGMLGMALVCMGLSPVQALAASPEFAYTEEEWASLRDNKLEFDEIARLVHEYNTTVQQNELDYKDYKGKTSLEIAEEYYDSANEVSERISYPSDDDANYASLISQALSSEIQADNLNTQGDNNVDDGDIKRLGYDQAEAQIVKQAQSLMITYWSQTKSLESLKENVTQAENSYESVLTRKAAGMAVQSEEETAKEAMTTARASLQSEESSLEATEKSLLVLLGWKYGDEVEIGTLPEPDLAAIEAIQVDSDIQTALNN